MNENKRTDNMKSEDKKDEKVEVTKDEKTQ